MEKEEKEPVEATPDSPHRKETIIDIPPVCSTANSSSYDTDCSTASSTCCTRQGEHIYMQRDPGHVPVTPLPEACGEDLDMLKYEQRRHWPWFILVISIIEVSVWHTIPFITSPPNQRHRQKLPFKSDKNDLARGAVKGGSFPKTFPWYFSSYLLPPPPRPSSDHQTVSVSVSDSMAPPENRL